MKTFTVTIIDGTESSTGLEIRSSAAAARSSAIQSALAMYANSLAVPAGRRSLTCIVQDATGIIASASSVTIEIKDIG
jgi:hypothetical protein